jgi:hypothetical protein
VLNAIKILF